MEIVFLRDLAKTRRCAAFKIMHIPSNAVGIVKIAFLGRFSHFASPLARSTKVAYGSTADRGVVIVATPNGGNNANWRTQRATASFPISSRCRDPRSAHRAYRSMRSQNVLSRQKSKEQS
ncbi:MAG: hypothetical protein IT473_01800 [Lysobacter sp.]|nr:hypothetical protein [Lysobacter sp.]